VTVLLTVLQIVAPVFILAAIGFAWVRVGAEFRLQFVTRLTMNVAVPALIFSALARAQIDPDTLKALLGASVAAYAAVTVAIWAMLRLGGLDMRTFLGPLVFGNTGNLGLPLAVFAFGEAGLGYAVVIFAVMVIYNFTAGIWFVSGIGSPARVLREPIVIGTLLGALFMATGWSLPVWANNAIDLVAQMAIPLMLLTLGVAIARLSAPRFGQAVVLSVAKALLCLAAALGAGMAFGLSGATLGVLALQLMTPVAVSSYMLADRFEADSGAVAGLVVVSTLLSVVALPLLLAFFV